MRFSIIIPAHNAEYFIGRTIDSILNQGFSDYEIIVVAFPMEYMLISECF